MLGPVLRIPGVYKRENVDFPLPALPTGVPAFVGLVAGDSYGPVPLRRKSEFPGGAAAYLEHAVNGFFDNGGSYCYVVGVQGGASGLASATALINGLELLKPLSDIDLVAIPDAVAVPDGNGGLDESLALEVQRRLVRHCMQEGNRMALLDALPGKTAQGLIDTQVKQLGVPGTGPYNAALYHPWIRTLGTGMTPVPPCGHMAGIIARTDAQAGVFKAPANAEIQGATDLDVELDAEAVAVLTEAGVNCLRPLPGRGIRVWGARTLSPDAQWRYVNVRRLVLTVLRWIHRNMGWASFESNVPALWARIQRELGVYLGNLWQAGALKGETAAEAFFVRCDADLNPPDMRDSGHVITEIGLAPAVPAEFIVVTLQHRAGTTELI